MRPVTKEIVTKLMNDQILDAQTARAKVAEVVNTSNLAKNTSREMVTEIARALITPNKFFDQKGTDDAKGQARGNMKTVYINKNDVLVKAGDVITEEIYTRLEKLKLLKDKANHLPQFGLGILCALLSFVIFMFVRQSNLQVKYNNSQLVMLVLIFVMNIAGMKIISLLQNFDYPFIVGYAVGPAILARRLGGLPTVGVMALSLALCAIVYLRSRPSSCRLSCRSERDRRNPRPRGGLHRGRVPGVRRPHRRDRSCPGHRHHVRQSGGRGRARYRRPPRVIQPCHGDRFRPGDPRLDAGDAHPDRAWSSSSRPRRKAPFVRRGSDARTARSKSRTSDRRLVGVGGLEHSH